MPVETQSYVCSKCDHPPFRTQNDLDDHISHMCEDIFSKSKSYVCSKCSRRFFTQKDLDLHIEYMIDAIDWEHNE